jgi:hypothetical protein
VCSAIRTLSQVPRLLQNARFQTLGLWKLGLAFHEMNVPDNRLGSMRLPYLRAGNYDSAVESAVGQLA